MDPQDFGFLDPDPEKIFGSTDPDPDPRGKISTKNCKKKLLSNPKSELIKNKRV